MPRFLITTRRDKRESAKPAPEAVKDFADVTIAQIHSPEMVTVDASEAAIERLRQKIGSTYHVESEIKRGLM
jgi:hypothetical protein